MISRRAFVATPALLTLTSSLGTHAQEAERHGLSYFGELKEAPDFKHFAYVNPKAPKGGTISLTGAQWAFNQSPETFNSFNTFILRGDAPFNLGRIFASLMAGSDDETDSLYGYVASGVTVSNNGRELTFRLNPAAKFHDGSGITAEDVAWTLNTFKTEGHPQLRIALAEMQEAVALAEDRLKVTLSEKATREMPLTIAGMAILSKTYYASRKFDETTMEPPLGSGPYKVGRFEQGRFVEYERVKDWWGENLPTMVGLNNFDIIRAEFFRDRDVAFEGFKGRTYTMREEFTSRVWATGYDFPAFREGK